MFHIVHQRAVHDPEAAGRRIIPGEIPVAGMLRAALREVRAALEDDREFGTHVIRAQPPGDCRRELRIGKFVVDRAHAVRHRLRRALEFAFRVFIAAFEEAEPAAFAQQVDGGLEGDELLQTGHVDAVAVRIPDRRRGRGDDDLLRIESVEDRQDRVFERVPRTIESSSATSVSEPGRTSP